MAGFQNIGQLQLIAGQFVGVVRHVQLLLADQLPVVTVGGAVEHVEVVVGAQAVGGGAGVVVGDVGRQADAALAGVVGPRGARLLDLVDGFMDQQDLAGQTRRRRHRLQEVGVLVRLAVLRRLFQVAVDKVVFVLETHRRVGAIAGHRGLAPVHRVGVAAVAQGGVPDRLQAVLGNRERHTAGGADDTVAAGRQLGAGGVGDRLVQVALRVGGAALGGIHVHLPGGVLLEHRHLARRQVRLVLVGIAGVDGEQQLVGRIRVGVVAAGDIAGYRLGDAAGKGGNGAGRIAGHFGPHRRQRLAEGGWVGRQQRCRAGGEGQHEGATEQGKIFFHCAYLLKLFGRTNQNE